MIQCRVDNIYISDNYAMFFVNESPPLTCSSKIILGDLKISPGNILSQKIPQLCDLLLELLPFNLHI